MIYKQLVVALAVSFSLSVAVHAVDNTGCQVIDNSKAGKVMKRVDNGDIYTASKLAGNDLSLLDQAAAVAAGHSNPRLALELQGLKGVIVKHQKDKEDALKYKNTTIKHLLKDNKRDRKQSSQRHEQELAYERAKTKSEGIFGFVVGAYCAVIVTLVIDKIVIPCLQGK